MTNETDKKRIDCISRASAISVLQTFRRRTKDSTAKGILITVEIALKSLPPAEEESNAEE